CVTGLSPFEGNDAIDTLNKVIRETPRPVSELRPATPVDLQRVIRRCLAKNADERFQSIKDVAIELKEIRRDLSGDVDTTVPPLSGSSANVSGRMSTAEGRAASSDFSPAAPTHVSSAEYVVSEIKRHKPAMAVGSIILVTAVILGIWFLGFRSASAAQIESLAVMPFVNASGNADLEYLSDGMTESLINALSQLPKLSVKA